MGLVFDTHPGAGDPVMRSLPGLVEGASTLIGPQLEVVTCDGGDCFEDWTHLALADEAGDFLFDPLLPPEEGVDDPAAEVNAWYHLQSFLGRYQELGFEGFDEPAIAVVGFPFDDWGILAGATGLDDRPAVLFSRLDDFDIAYDPDVYGHELGHLVLPIPDPAIVSTGLSGAVPALAEGSADYFSASTMGDPDTGEWSADFLGLPWLNSADNDIRCPDDLVGQAHADGRMWQGALWDLRELFGQDLVDRAAWQTLSSLGYGPSWQDVATGLRQALEPELDASQRPELLAVLTDRGMLDCEPFLRLAPGDPAWLEVPSSDEEVWDPDTGEAVDYGRLPTALQLVVNVPGDATEVRFGLEQDREEDDPLVQPSDLTVHLRWDEPVEWAAQGDELTVTADRELLASEPLVLAAPPAGLLYASISSRSGEGAFFDVFVEIDSAR